MIKISSRLYDDFSNYYRLKKKHYKYDLLEMYPLQKLKINVHPVTQFVLSYIRTIQRSSYDELICPAWWQDHVILIEKIIALSIHDVGI